MASRNSAAVSSSHFTESLDCAWMEQTATRDTSREQVAARFIEFPPRQPCILARFHVLEPPLFGLNSEAEDDDDLDDEKADDQADNAANPIRAEQCDSEERSNNRGAAPEGIADSGGPQADLRGEEFGNVNRDGDGNENIHRHSQQETGREQGSRLVNVRVNAADEDCEDGATDDGGLTSPRIGSESSDG